jgi:hypothetical protein
MVKSYRKSLIQQTLIDDKMLSYLSFEANSNIADARKTAANRMKQDGNRTKDKCGTLSMSAAEYVNLNVLAYFFVSGYVFLYVKN